MKKTLLLSIVASTMIMAGGDIAPVEPAVVTPAPAPVVAESNWKFSGQGVVYYQTDDAPVAISGAGTGDLFDQDAAGANAGLQFTVTNADVIAGIGFGAQANVLGTLGLEEDVVSNIMQRGDSLNSAYLSQLYLTYGVANTSLKVGRQELPKALSPFAYSEDWNVFTNTFNAALLVNTDLPDTVLVGAWVRDNNVNGMHAAMNNFGSTNDGDGVWMLTAQNKSIADLTLTGSWYYGNEFITPDDVNILWADAQYNAGIANIGIQGGTVMHDAFPDDITAVGAQVSGKLDMINASLAYSHTNDGGIPGLGLTGAFNVAGSTSALYTETALNQVAPAALANLRFDADKYVVTAGADVLGGNLTGVYAYSDTGLYSDFNEVDVVYATHITENLVGVLAYVYTDIVPGDVNLIRAVAKYNF